MVSKSEAKNVMMVIQTITMVVLRHAQSNHAIKAVPAMDGYIHGPIIHVQRFAETVSREVKRNATMAIQTTMTVAHRHAKSSPVT
jgi:hypothetical protein